MSPTPCIFAVFKVLLDAIPGHLSCPPYGRRCRELEPVPQQGFHFLQLRLDSEDLGPQHKVCPATACALPYRHPRALGGGG